MTLIDAPVAMSAARAIRFADPGGVLTNRHARTRWFDVHPGEELFISAEASDNGSAPRKFTPQWYFWGVKKDGSASEGVLRNFDPTTGVTTRRLTHTFTVPADVVKLRIGFGRLNSNGDQTELGTYGAPSIRRRNSGELIVDGALTARHVGTNEIIADTANIKDAIITSAKIANIDAAKVKITGSTYLSSWAGQTNTTLIDGGKIDTNSIRADALQIGARENLIPNGEFMSDAAIGELWSFSNAASQGYNTSTTYNGRRSLYFTKTGSGVEGYALTQPAFRFEVTPGETVGVSAVLQAGAAAGAGVYVQVQWYQADRTTASAIRARDSAAANVALGTSWTEFSGALTAPADASYGAFRVVSVAATGPLTIYLGAAAVVRQRGAIIIRDGSIQTPHLEAGAITTETIAAGAVHVENMTVDGLLTIRQGGALQYGKVSLGDEDTDGIYFGRDADSGFGLVFSRSDGDKSQSLRLSSDGLVMRNTRHRVLGASPPTIVTRTASQARTALPGAVQVRILAALGGGKGGEGSQAVGGNGGDTIIRLYDGSTLKQTITANGATVHNASRSQPVASAIPPYGNGGIGATWRDDENRARYGRNGKPTVVKSETFVDTSAWVNPQIEIVIGAGGAAGASWPGKGLATAGSAGYCRYAWSTVAEVPADVVPLVPTASGTFAKSANTAGTFPDLGAGFWVIDTTTADVNMTLGNVTVSPGNTIRVGNVQHASFFASQTPSYSGGANARTISYLFYSMGSWG